MYDWFIYHTGTPTGYVRLPKIEKKFEVNPDPSATLVRVLRSERSHRIQSSNLLHRLLTGITGAPTHDAKGVPIRRSPPIKNPHLGNIVYECGVATVIYDEIRQNQFVANAPPPTQSAMPFMWSSVSAHWREELKTRSLAPGLKQTVVAAYEASITTSADEWQEFKSYKYKAEDGAVRLVHRFDSAVRTAAEKAFAACSAVMKLSCIPEPLRFIPFRSEWTNIITAVRHTAEPLFALAVLRMKGEVDTTGTSIGESYKSMSILRELDGLTTTTSEMFDRMIGLLASIQSTGSTDVVKQLEQTAGCMRFYSTPTVIRAPLVMAPPPAVTTVVVTTTTTTTTTTTSHPAV
jgi:hypothetical protein